MLLTRTEDTCKWGSVVVIWTGEAITGQGAQGPLAFRFGWLIYPGTRGALDFYPCMLAEKKRLKKGTTFFFGPDKKRRWTTALVREVWLTNAWDGPRQWRSSTKYDPGASICIKMGMGRAAAQKFKTTQRLAPTKWMRAFISLKNRLLASTTLSARFGRPHRLSYFQMTYLQIKINLWIKLLYICS
jgi:hypothetical protein